MFYEFSQNNSGGSFDVDEKICHRVVIEANSEEEAEQKAFAMGVYYDGVETGEDCECCGDRWDGCDILRFPLPYGKDVVFEEIESYMQYRADKYGWTKPDARIFYQDGTVKEIFSERVK